MNPIAFLTLLLGATVVPLFSLPWLFRHFCSAIGSTIRDRARPRRQLLFERARAEEQEEQRNKSKAKRPSTTEDADWEKVDNPNGDKAPADWEGVVGFFHPFCNAGGGGERVLWAAIRATQHRYPKTICVVYTGDHDADKDTILNNVSTRFNIHLHAPRVSFRYLSTRQYVLASTWPRFTLLGQSFGSLILAWDAFNLIVPDIFIDTMGYAFGLAFCKLLFPTVPTCAYVHYPTISTDMLSSLDDATGGKGVNAGLGKGWKGQAKRRYWEIFAWLYSFVGGTVDVVMTNSSWTQNHMLQLWDPARRRRSKTSPIKVVFPPVAVEELESAVPVDAESETLRTKDLIYISQFRPEKNHALLISAFASFVRRNPVKNASSSPTSSLPKLILIGSVRDDTDNLLVYKLRVMAREASVADRVQFIINASWSQILTHLRTACVGVNGMWNEHFGIGVVEYQAAGLISVVNDSGGPKMDIVVDIDGQPTGFHAETEQQYAEAFEKALSLSEKETLAMRSRARKSARRFTEAEFRRSWIERVDALVALAGRK